MLHHVNPKINVRPFISLLFAITLLISCGGGGGGSSSSSSPVLPGTLTFTITTLDSTGDVGEYTSVALDSSDNTHISYYDFDNSTLKYATNASGTWIIDTPDTSGNDVGYHSSSIAIDSHDKVHISYHDWTGKNLKYVTNATGSWTVKDDIDTSGNDVGWFSSIAVDSNDKVHIAYTEYIGSKGTVKYATNASGVWTAPETPDTSGNDIGDNVSIAVQTDGTVHVSYYDLDDKTLKYATNGSGTWVVSNPDTSGDDVGDYSSLALDSNNKIHISYYNWAKESLKYATNASGSWAITTVEGTDSVTDDVGMYSSIAVDSSDNVHIAYYDLTNGHLKYATNASGSWVTATADRAADVGEFSSIATGSDDKVHISYYDNDNGNLKYAVK